MKNFYSLEFTKYKFCALEFNIRNDNFSCYKVYQLKILKYENAHKSKIILSSIVSYLELNLWPNNWLLLYKYFVSGNEILLKIKGSYKIKLFLIELISMSRIWKVTLNKSTL